MHPTKTTGFWAYLSLRLKALSLTESSRSLEQDNLITDGDFDDDELSSEWQVNGDYKLHWDGYIRNGLFLDDHSEGSTDPILN